MCVPISVWKPKYILVLFTGRPRDVQYWDVTNKHRGIGAYVCYTRGEFLLRYVSAVVGCLPGAQLFSTQQTQRRFILENERRTKKPFCALETLTLADDCIVHSRLVYFGHN